MVFDNGNGIIVTASGPGKIHLLSYQSNGGIQNIVGTVETTSSGLTRFMISHSYSFERFAFYWEGAGEAVFGTSLSLTRTPVTKSWDSAITIAWASRSSFGQGSVTAEANKALNRDNMITCFVIPDNIL